VLPSSNDVSERNGEIDMPEAQLTFNGKPVWCDLEPPIIPQKGDRYFDDSSRQWVIFGSWDAEEHPKHVFNNVDKVIWQRPVYFEHTDNMLGELFKQIDDRVKNSKGDLAKEITRLKAGDFSEEEFQNLCHKFQDTDKQRFCDGCEAYQIKLFGSSPITELKKDGERLTIFIEQEWFLECADLGLDNEWRVYDRYHTPVGSSRHGARNAIDKAIERYRTNSGITPDPA
jgi:hypothetical protein